MAIQTESEQLMIDRKTIVTVKNFAGKFKSVNLDKARRMVAQDEATIISEDKLNEMTKSVEKLNADKAKKKATK